MFEMMTVPLNDREALYQRLADELVAGLRARSAGKGAPRVGDQLPDFALPDEYGRITRLNELLMHGPAIISFMRGQWCPYCEAELSAWNKALPDLEKIGARFICVVGQTGGAARAIRSCFAGSASVLCDVDHGLALSLGLAFFVGQEAVSAYQDDGLDLQELYGTAAGILPIPATFAVAADRTVRAAFVEPDFRVRATPDAMIATLR